MRPSIRAEYVLPTFHEPLPSATEVAKPKAAPEAPAMEAPAEGEPVDPFGATSGDAMAPADAAADPFAVPATPPAGNANPF